MIDAMSYISLQITIRHGARTAAIVESWRDPLSGQKCMRTLRCCGSVEKGEKKDPCFLDHINAQVQALRRKAGSPDTPPVNLAAGQAQPA